MEQWRAQAMQPGPRYPTMAIEPHGVFFRDLQTKYGDNVAWPVVWYSMQGLRIDAITFEVNERNRVNAGLDADADIVQPIELPAFTIDYLENPRQIVPMNGAPTPNYLQQAIEDRYVSTYDYRARNRLHLATVDVDYLWRSGVANHAMEVSTFYVPMRDRARAEHLVNRFVEERPARLGAHHFHLLVRAAEAMGADMVMVFVNVVDRTPEVVEDGNAFWFPLDAAQATRLHNGQMPDRTNFGPLTDFLATL
jgi:hypothetical protein